MGLGEPLAEVLDGDACVASGRLDVAMPEELLHVADVGAVLEET